MSRDIANALAAHFSGAVDDSQGEPQTVEAEDSNPRYGRPAHQDGQAHALSEGYEQGNQAYSTYRAGQFMGNTHGAGKDARKPYPRSGDPELADEQALQRGKY